MHKTASAARRWLCATMVLMTFTIESGAQSRDRAQIPEKFRWNTAEIYPTDAAWRTAKEKLTADVKELRHFQGKLGSSAAALADMLDTQAGFNKELNRLFT